MKTEKSKYVSKAVCTATALVCSAVFSATFTKDNLEVVISPDASPVVRFAASEATNFLSRTFSAAIPLTGTPSKGKAHLFLGTNSWSEAAGVSVSGIATDGFVIVSKGDDVFIAGEDDLKINPEDRINRAWWGSHLYDHGTINGVYAFLENVAGVRFYFPGDLGTCIEKKKELTIPEGKSVCEPALTIRRWSYYSDGEWPEGDDPNRKMHPMKALNILRNRVSTKNYYCCHGLNGFRYVERFGETHPEYFALNKKGERMIYGKGWERGHLCLSSGIREEIFKDCLSFLKGEDASVRGIPSLHKKNAFGWNINTSEVNIDLMPQDGHGACYCDNCKKLLRQDGRDCPATELVWGLLAEVAARLKKEGYEPTFTMMSYADYADLPDLALPTNIKVMVAKTGPWRNTVENNVKDDAGFYAKWERRLGEKTWIWTYPLRGETLNYDVPGWAPRAWGKYYKGVAPRIFGFFAQSETDRCIDNLLSYYVFSRIGWNPNVDVDGLIDEFYERMFASAAGEMRKALDITEEKFINNVVGKIRMTDKGPVSERSGDYALWAEIYSEKETARLERLYDAALRKVPANSLEAKRIALFRKWMFEPVARRGREYRRIIDVKQGVEYYRKYEKDNLLGDDWWIAPDLGASRDKDNTIVSGESKKLTLTDKRFSAWALSNRMKKGMAVEPGATYSLSWFMKVDLETIQCGGGAAMSLGLLSPDKKWVKSWKVPEKMLYHSGKIDWIRQETTFTVPKDVPIGTRFSVMPFVRYCIGEAWFDGLLLRKIDDGDDKR
jgi:hypothetical protein